MRKIDLRSDTVTLPTDIMRKAMYAAEVGDDVYGEDPTVQELEQLGAQMAKKDAGLFVTSGTMGNQLAVMVHTQRGDEVICEAESHIYYYEVGGLAYLAGVQARPVVGTHGILPVEAVSQAIRTHDIHQPKTSLICVENTHNRAGGTYYTLEQLQAIYKVAHTHNIPLHMDGARIFNAAVAQNVTVEEITQYTDSVNICLSKGLCAPIGSLLLGSKTFIEKARRYRKLLGGGMRQAGIIAAAGLVSLRTMVERLTEDHENAKMLAEAVANLGFDIELGTVQTNIIIFSVAPFRKKSQEVLEFLSTFGIKANSFGEYKVRFVTHRNINREDIHYTIEFLSKFVKG